MKKRRFTVGKLYARARAKKKVTVKIVYARDLPLDNPFRITLTRISQQGILSTLKTARKVHTTKGRRK
jgi:hypothetical protein